VGSRRGLAIRWREVAASAAALAGLYVVAAVYLRPIGPLWRTHIAPNQEDPLFVLYMLKWVGHEAGRGFAGFWDAPFFYPARGVFAWSDHMLGPGLAAAAWNALVPGWVGAYNLLLLSSFAWTGGAMAWVLRRSGRSWPAAVLGAGTYAFCPFRWDQTPHLQVLMMAAIPLTLWSFDRLLARPAWGRAAGFLACYAVHLSGGAYLAAMIHAPLAVLACNRWAEAWRWRRPSGRAAPERAGLARPAGGRQAPGREGLAGQDGPRVPEGLPWEDGPRVPEGLPGQDGPRVAEDLPGQDGPRVRWPVLLTAFAAAGGMAAAIFSPYRRAGAGEGLAWTAAAQRHWGASLLSFLQPSAGNLYGGLWPERLFRSENCLFPGWIALALCLAGLVLFRRGASPAPAWPALIPDAGRAAPSRPGSAAAARGASAGAAARPWWRLLPLVPVLLGWTAAELLTWSEAPALAGLARPGGRWPGASAYELPLALVLAGAAGWAALHRRATGRWPGASLAALDPWPRGLLLAGTVTALLSMPLFYLPLARWLPGLAAMRVPARFQAFTMVTIAFFAAAAFDALAARLRRRRAALFTAAVLAAALVELAPRGMTWEPLAEEEDFPPVYAWLAQQKDVHALLELPLENPASEWRGPASLQAMYFGTRHWHPLVNGFSAHFPPAYVRLEATCCDPMPDPATLAGLEGWGVTHILIHRRSLPNRERRALDEWTETSDAELVYATGGDRVYRLPRPAR
jgi:hypothetical protein